MAAARLWRRAIGVPYVIARARPAAFAARIACPDCVRSVMRSSAAPSAGASRWAMPMLAETSTRPAPGTAVAACGIATSSRAASSSASSGAPSTSTPNSSPPQPERLRRDAGAPALRGELDGHGDEHGVAVLVAEQRVDVLEAVEVDRQHARRPVRRRVQARQGGLQRAAVADAGERVGRRQVGEPAQEPALLRAPDRLPADERAHERAPEHQVRRPDRRPRDGERERGEEDEQERQDGRDDEPPRLGVPLASARSARAERTPT